MTPFFDKVGFENLTNIFGQFRTVQSGQCTIKAVGKVLHLNVNGKILF